MLPHSIYLKPSCENRDIDYTMLIGSYRKNEVDEEHPLYKKINELKEGHVPFGRDGIKRPFLSKYI